MWLMIQTGKSLGNKVVLAKIPREEFTRFQQYCDQNGETINASLRRMIVSAIENPQPARIACKSVFDYNKAKDNFSWKVIFDDDAVFEIDDDLPVNSLEQLLDALHKGIDERDLFIRKRRVGSVSFPSMLLNDRK